MIIATRSIPRMRRENVEKGHEHDIVLVDAEGGGALRFRPADDAARDIAYTYFMGCCPEQT